MRAAVINDPAATPVCADFPDPEQRGGGEPPRLVGAGLHHVVRALAAGGHYDSNGTYPLVPGSTPWPGPATGASSTRASPGRRGARWPNCWSPRSRWSCPPGSIRSWLPPA